MAYQTNGGTAAPAKQGMKDLTNTNIARDGAAKRPQTSFATTHGMRDRTAEMAGVSPANPGVGPDADPANPLSPSPKLKKFPDAPAKWGMRDANGQSVNGNLGHAVLAEASNLGR
jgi:hypothetical protein